MRRFKRFPKKRLPLPPRPTEALPPGQVWIFESRPALEGIISKTWRAGFWRPAWMEIIIE